VGLRRRDSLPDRTNHPKEQEVTETTHELQRYQKMELALLEKDRKIRALEEALHRTSARCPFCGNQVVLQP
jgi:SUMO ligase MMS21 Smc5/6 complex component